MGRLRSGYGAICFAGFGTFVAGLAVGKADVTIVGFLAMGLGWLLLETEAS